MHNDTKNSCFLIDNARGMLYTNGFRNVLSLGLGPFDLVRFEVLSRWYRQRPIVPIETDGTDRDR